jgi:hypothetical protein
VAQLTGHLTVTLTTGIGKHTTQSSAHEKNLWLTIIGINLALSYPLSAVELGFQGRLLQQGDLTVVATNNSLGSSAFSFYISFEPSP